MSFDALWEHLTLTTALSQLPLRLSRDNLPHLWKECHHTLGIILDIIILLSRELFTSICELINKNIFFLPFWFPTTEVFFFPNEIESSYSFNNKYYFPTNILNSEFQVSSISFNINEPEMVLSQNPFDSKNNSLKCILLFHVL